MRYISKPKLKTVCIILLVIFAYVARILGNKGIQYNVLGLLRSSIYIYLMIVWGLSMQARVIQVHVRRYLTAVSVLAVFWIFIRTIKYQFIPVQSMARPVWYMYYLPMLFIPLMAVYIAMSLGRSENYRLPGYIRALAVPTALLFLMVLTNDSHQMIFVFPPQKPWTDYDYSYAPAYFLVIGWECLLSFLAFAIMIKRCRIRSRFKAFPLAFMGLSLLYTAMYYGGVKWLRILAGDLAVAQCCLMMLVFESCIRCGLIQNNTGYDELLEACSFGVQITDSEYTTLFASATAPKLKQEMMRQAEEGPVFPDKNTQIKSNRIPGGHVLWREDITELVTAIEDLNTACEELSEHNRIARENYKTKQRISALREKNRLMDMLQHNTEKQIELLDRLRSQYEEEKNEAVRCRILTTIALVGTYIKRSGNLLFIRDKNSTTDIGEFVRCIEESFYNLELLGISCGMDIPTERNVVSDDAIRAYGIFETIMEYSVESIDSVWIKGRDTGKYMDIHINIHSLTDLSGLSEVADDFSGEENEWRFIIRMRKGGA